MIKTLTIQGASIHDIPSFYAEMNRVFMAAEDWTLGESLDALDDLLRGGYGAISGNEAVRIVWRDMEKSRSDLGLGATRAWLESKLARPDIFNAERIDRQLDALGRGEGETYFETIMQIIADHENIELVPA